MMQKRADEKSPAYNSTGRRGRSLPAALCGVVGKLILLVVILACLPVPVARVCGYEVYNVVSGSMEPAIPVGSAVFVRPAPPAQIAAEDIIAFESHDTVITHRVVENDKLTSSFTTQGDANARPDPEPVPYGSVIGRVERHVPGLGWLLSAYTAGSGRVYFICFAVAGALLSLIPALMPKKRGKGEEEPSSSAYAQGRAEVQETQGQEEPSAAARAQGGAEGQVNSEPEAPARARRGAGGGIRRVLMILLALIFAGSIGGFAYTRWRAQAQRQTYTDLAQQVATATDVPDAVQAQDAPDADTPPITVDFEALHAVNSDIVGWIYCEGTAINYPVLYGETNDTYLRHDYERKYNIAGSIFVDVKNNADFSDVNTIIYGHHMNDDSMFAGLENWQDQAYFDAHPVIWLFTPQQTYKILPFSAYDTNAYSETYTIFSGPCEQLDTYLQTVAAQSVVSSDIVPNGADRHVLLSTCSAAFNSGDNRSVLHGVLQPVG